MVDATNPASANICYTLYAIIPRLLVYEVTQDFYHQQYLEPKSMQNDSPKEKNSLKGHYSTYFWDPCRT